MKLLYTLLFAFFISCSTEPEDCAGVEGGSAYLDDCEQCVGGTTANLANYLQDCSGECGGDAIEDCAGVCNGDAEADYFNGVYQCCTTEYEEDCHSHLTWGYEYMCYDVSNPLGGTHQECENVYTQTGYETHCHGQIEVTECFN